jgi:hypothetical protein
MPEWQAMQLFRNRRLRAEVVHQRVAEHRAVGARDEECLRGGTGGDHAGSRIGRNAIRRRLRRLHQVVLEADALRFKCGVVVVVRR